VWIHVFMPATAHDDDRQISRTLAAGPRGGTNWAAQTVRWAMKLKTMDQMNS
jgi:hypothetical protein